MFSKILAVGNIAKMFVDVTGTGDERISFKIKLSCDMDITSWDNISICWVVVCNYTDIFLCVMVSPLDNPFKNKLFFKPVI